ncbi:MAG: hypothetical protein IKL17_08515 [Alistipes sp.]|nr:hypothetical protein [Alistipes sp.]
MRVTILQRDIVWGNHELNLSRADKAIDENANADLYILPEMFSTGFCTSPEGIAEIDGAISLQWLKAKAAGDLRRLLL